MLKYDKVEKIEFTFDREFTRGGKGIKLLNVPMAFDLEASSFYDQGEKKAVCYLWTFAIDDHVFYGRTLDEYEVFIEKLKMKLALKENELMQIFVHNLSYDFQFIRKRFDFNKVLANKIRKPITATCSNAIYRCSYMITRKSLDLLSKSLNLDYKKLTGTFDYDLLRLPCTPLTADEMAYAEMDVRAVIAWIKKESADFKGKISKIPNTQTGYVRRYCRDNCLPRDRYYDRLEYASLIKKLTLTLPEYKSLKNAFRGGVVMSGQNTVGETLEDVGSVDFTSSYPYVMMSELYPMSSAEFLEEIEMDEILKDEKHLYVFDICFLEIGQKSFGYGYISKSKCHECIKPVVANGIVFYADRLITTITNADLEIIKAVYQWKAEKIVNVYKYKKAYLPRVLMKSIAELYKNKTKLKGKKGEEKPYLNLKEMLNGVFGMSVTDIMRNVVTITDGDWTEEKADAEEVIERYNSDNNRFLSYAWGVFVTAYARRNLFKLILAIKPDDFVYCDTDCVKFLHPENYKKMLEAYNLHVKWKNDFMVKRMDFDKEYYRPKSENGIEFEIGFAEYEQHYKKFKTIGAKRYIGYDENDEFLFTVAGLSKETARQYLMDAFKDKIFENFKTGLHVPADKSGKLTMTYLDEGCRGIAKDYLGNVSEYYEKTCVHSEKSAYDLTIAQEYMDFIDNFRGYENE